MSDTLRVCPNCGKPLAADAPQGICPECLLKAGFATSPGASSGENAGFVPPSVHDIAQLFPQLEILELIGKGGMGAVYKARQPGLDRMVALKILPPRTGADPGFAERFTREARALARLSHPNIVAVHDFGQVPLPAGGGVGPAAPQTAAQLHYFIMEYVDGANLRRIEQAGKLSPREALQLIPQICEALQFAHDEGIVHRDIKPENVLVDKKGRVKIADFGLAKILGLEPREMRLTGARDIMGTPHYMAPEQVEHPQAVDHRADIYSLGVVFYEMLTGELPLGKFAPPSTRAGGIRFDVRLDEVVLRALSKEPERRYQHASQVKTDLEAIATPGAVSAAKAPGPSASSTPANHILDQVRPPAIGLVAVGILNWLVLPLVILIALPNLARGLWWGPFHVTHAQVLGLSVAKFTGIGLLATPFVFCSFLIYAGLKMLRLEAYVAAVAASILALVITPANLVGFPIGIWALVVLSRREVREAFQKKEVIGLTGGHAASKRSWWPWVLGTAGLLFLLAVFALIRNGNRGPATPAAVPLVIKSFTAADPTISHDLLLTRSDSAAAWSVTCTSTQTFRLFEVSEPGVEQCKLSYRAKLKTEGLAGRAYLEMWCHLPGRGESFSRGLDNVISGSNDWSSYETPFFLQAGERPDLIRLNLVVEGAGKVFIKDVELETAPLP